MTSHEFFAYTLNPLVYLGGPQISLKWPEMWLMQTRGLRRPSIKSLHRGGDRCKPQIIHSWCCIKVLCFLSHCILCICGSGSEICQISAALSSPSFCQGMNGIQITRLGLGSDCGSKSTHLGAHRGTLTHTGSQFSHYVPHYF